MYGATFGQQSKHLRLWIEEDVASGPKPAKLDFIVSVMFWIAVPYLSQARSSRRALHAAVALGRWYFANMCVHVRSAGCVRPPVAQPGSLRHRHMHCVDDVRPFGTLMLYHNAWQA